MPRIATLTMNPTVDITFEVERLRPTHKLRGPRERCHPGGGGINVARAFARLGGEASCHYLRGGPAGVLLDRLLEERRVEERPIGIAGATRIAATLLETESGLEYRIVPPGPEVSATDCDAALAALARVEGAYLVASGSLPPGAPADFYARVGQVAAAGGVPFALDTSGEPLRAALAAGGIAVIKPSHSELETVAGRKLDKLDEIEAAARAVVATGGARLVAVSLGARGAMVVGTGDAAFVPAPAIEARSATGAGDSFFGALLFRLAAGDEPRSALRFAVAAGAAAVLNPGGDLCRPADIERLLAAMPA